MSAARFFTYLHLQWKRALRHLPPILGAAAILLAAALLFGASEIRTHLGDDARQKIRVGVVGDMQNRWVSLGMETLEHLD